MANSILSGVPVGPEQPVRIIGVINASPESFFRGSVAVNARAIAEAARRLEVAGADFIDVGAMSTAPYLKTEISEEEEAFRLKAAVQAIRRMSRLPVSIDTSRFLPAMAGFEAGATILNDVTGLRRDPKIHPLLKKFRGVIVMAHPSGLHEKTKNPVKATIGLLRESIGIARRADVADNRIVVDPGIGFFRDAGLPWWKWDVEVLHNLPALAALKCPILAGVSRKSFIGKILGVDKPEDRLVGSLAAAVVAVLNGASLIRTHDVKETREAVRIAELFAGPAR